MRDDKWRSMTFTYQQFRDYYATFEAQLPYEPFKREWAIVPFGGTMCRHIAFTGPDELVSYMRNTAPAAVYHSGARYEDPGNEVMANKGRIGCDLLFDLDAEFEKGETYTQTLEKTKREAITLLEILKDELGFKEYRIVFSGGRGYHIHVMDKGIQPWTRAERSEILDYVCPKVKFIDVVVTHDVTRVIRLPGSLHVKSGMRSCLIDNLETFDPMTDAIGIKELQT